MDAQIKLSVIIPVYNAEKYLRQCLESVLGQTLKEIEVICIDDCSSDRSLEILMEYAAKDSRMNVIKNDANMKAGPSRNRGIASARGRYLHFMDADDYLAPDAYSVLYGAAAAKDLDVVKAKAYAVDAVTSEEIFVPLYAMAALGKRDFDRVTDFHKAPETFTRLPVTPWSGIYKRTFISENGIRFNNLVCVNDRSFYCEVIVKAKSVMFLDFCLLYHRLNNPASLVGVRAKNFGCLFQSYGIIRDLCSELPRREAFYVLESEIYDVFSWYRKYQREGVLDDNIVSATKDFICGLDTAVFGKKLKRCRWYPDYLELTGKKPALFYRIGRALTRYPRKAGKFMRYISKFGFGATFKLVRKNLVLHGGSK